MISWHVEEALKQARSRELNESVARVNEPGCAESRLEEFSCECGDPGCEGHVRLSMEEYESVRAHPGRFVVVANHENPEVERVVLERTRYAIVETLAGQASKTALRSSPRRTWPLVEE